MKKKLLLFFITSSILCVHNVSSCPHEFSSEDPRPFFEQYDIETNTSTPQEKE